MAWIEIKLKIKELEDKINLIENGAALLPKLKKDLGMLKRTLDLLNETNIDPNPLSSDIEPKNIFQTYSGMSSAFESNSSLILKVLTESKGTALSLQDISSYLKSNNKVFSYATLTAVLSQLVRDKKIIRLGRGMYAIPIFQSKT